MPTAETRTTTALLLRFAVAVHMVTAAFNALLIFATMGVSA